MSCTTWRCAMQAPASTTCTRPVLSKRCVELHQRLLRYVEHRIGQERRLVAGLQPVIERDSALAACKSRIDRHERRLAIVDRHSIARLRLQRGQIADRAYRGVLQGEIEPLGQQPLRGSSPDRQLLDRHLPTDDFPKVIHGAWRNSPMPVSVATASRIRKMIRSRGFAARISCG